MFCFIQSGKGGAGAGKGRGKPVVRTSPGPNVAGAPVHPVLVAAKPTVDAANQTKSAAIQIAGQKQSAASPAPPTGSPMPTILVDKQANYDAQTKTLIQAPQTPQTIPQHQQVFIQQMQHLQQQQLQQQYHHQQQAQQNPQQQQIQPKPIMGTVFIIFN